jgi:uncharacterized protein (TIGR02757 family)
MDDRQFSDVCFPRKLTREFLEGLYERYNHRRYIPPDPLEFVHLYEHPGDREVVGLIASALAYGRVAQIHRSVSSVLKCMGPSPHGFILEHSPRFFRECFRGFKHRFTTHEQLTALLEALRTILIAHGSLEACFTRGLKREDATILGALSRFAEELRDAMGESDAMFIPSPAKGSACKRLHLFLRWMVRRDDVDPGVWKAVSPGLLLVPVDVHMHRMGALLGLTRRRQADLQAVQEITEGFRCVVPEDPVRYDFALTRIGIHGKVPRQNDT